MPTPTPRSYRLVPLLLLPMVLILLALLPVLPAKAGLLDDITTLIPATTTLLTPATATPAASAPTTSTTTSPTTSTPASATTPSTTPTTTPTTTSSTTPPATTSQQPVTAASVPLGEAQAVIIDLLGRKTVLADSGRLEQSVDARHNSLPEASLISAVPGNLLTADVLHATTTAAANQVDSTASLANLRLSAGSLINVQVDFIRSEATAIANGTGSGNAVIDGLSVNGLGIPVTGAINQVVNLTGGRLIINEHQAVPGGVRVNALHLVVTGVAEVTIASATAGVPQ